MSKKILISTFPFSRNSTKPMEILKSSGFEFVINPLNKKLNKDELFTYGHDCDAIVVGTEDLSAIVEKSEKLKLISRIGIGLDSVPLDICQKKGIEVCYTPDAVTDAVSELTLGLMISLTRKIAVADKKTREGDWSRFEGKSLKEMTIGLVGFGRIGVRVAETLIGFKVKHVIVNDVLDKSAKVFQLRSQGLNIESGTLDDITTKSDLISLHLPRTPKTNHLFNGARLARVKPGCLIVNTARGGLIDEPALKASIESGKVAGAALDVFEQEPYRGELCSVDEIIMTQHMGSCSFEARDRMESEAMEDVIRFLKGQPMNNRVDLALEMEKLK